MLSGGCDAHMPGSGFRSPMNGEKEFKFYDFVENLARNFFFYNLKHLLDLYCDNYKPN